MSSGYDQSNTPGLLIIMADGRKYLRKHHNKDASSFYYGQQYPGVVGPLDDPIEEPDDWCINVRYAVGVKVLEPEEVNAILRKIEEEA